MATRIVVAVRDRAMDAFGQPFFVPSVGLAVRSFGDEINNPDGAMFKHPEDFDLYQIGEYEEETGRLVPLERPRQVAIGKEHVKVVQ